MKNVCKVLCAIMITIFISSCATKGSGCYDFGYDNSSTVKGSNTTFIVNSDNKVDDVDVIKPTNYEVSTSCLMAR